MARIAVGAALLLSTLATTAHADQEQPEVGTAIACSRPINGCTAHPDLLDEVQAAADEAGVSALDLLGAVNTTGLGPREYLTAVGELAPARAVETSAVTVARVRLTWYSEAGLTYGGGHTYLGSAACSWNFRLGQRFVLPDGEVFTCVDRGLLGSTGWLDLWRRPDLVRRFGPFATVEVLP